MRLLSIHDIDKDVYSNITTHENILMLIIIKDWCRESEIQNLLSVIFRDQRGAVVSHDARLGDLPTIPSFPTVVKVTVQRIEKTGDVLTTLLKPQHRLSSTNWTVEPTIGEESSGRWIARPILDLCSTVYQVMAALVTVDKEIDFTPVTLQPSGTVANVREILAEAKGRPVEDFFYVYEWGDMCKTEDGLKHATTYCIQGIQKRMDDDFHKLAEGELFPTICHIYEDTKFSIPLAGGPLWVFHVANKYFCLSKEEAAPYHLLADQIRPLDDPSFLCFVDGFCLQDRRQPEPRTPRLFASFERGDVFVDVVTGKLFASREELSRCDVQEEIPEDCREWGSFAFLFRDREPLPRWRLPADKDMQIHFQPHLRMRIQDGRLTSERPRGPARRWHISTAPEMEEGSPGISEYMRSRMEPEGGLDTQL